MVQLHYVKYTPINKAIIKDKTGATEISHLRFHSHTPAGMP